MAVEAQDRQQGCLTNKAAAGLHAVQGAGARQFGHCVAMKSGDRDQNILRGRELLDRDLGERLVLRSGLNWWF